MGLLSFLTGRRASVVGEPAALHDYTMPGPDREITLMKPLGGEELFLAGVGSALSTGAHIIHRERNGKFEYVYRVREVSYVAGSSSQWRAYVKLLSKRYVIAP